ncbi:DUF6338 family protein [Amycolatopsis sp. NPDC003865]
MFPQTLGAVIAFLGLVAPGLTFELSRERKRAPRQESAFREAARVGLASFGLTAVSCVAIYLGWRTAPSAAIDFPAWLQSGNPFFQRHLLLILATGLAEVALACALGVLVALAMAVFGRNRSSITHLTGWQEAFRQDLPRKTNAWLHVQLKDKQAFLGYLEWYTVGEKPEDRELVLEGRALTQATLDDRGSLTNVRRIGDNWEKVVIAATEISYIRVVYNDPQGNRRESARRRREVVPADEPQQETLPLAIGEPADGELLPPA